jgi:hypothetical protein
MSPERFAAVAAIVCLAAVLVTLAASAVTGDAMTRCLAAGFTLDTCHHTLNR